MKITEPKTPYIHYDRDTDEFNGASTSIPPLELVAAMERAVEASGERHGRLSRDSTQSRLEDEADSQSNLLLNGLKNGMHLSQESSAGEGSNNIIRSVTNEWESDEDEEERIKRDRFNALRSQHYKMKDIIKRGKQLLQNEEEDEHYNDPDKYANYDDDEKPSIKSARRPKQPMNDSDDDETSSNDRN